MVQNLRCQIDFQECKYCKTIVWKVKNKKGHYVDNKNKRWHGARCPSCNRSRLTAFDRRRGMRPIDDVENHNNVVGRAHEKLIKEMLESIGATDVTLTINNGPDVTFYFGGKKLTAEVKTILERKNLTFFVNPISYPRRKDDFIFLVFKNVIISMEEMNEHLSQTYKCGVRNVTGIVRAALKVNQ